MNDERLKALITHHSSLIIPNMPFNERAFLTKLRGVCLALPKASECLSFGHPTWKAGKKTFAVFEEYRGRKSLVVSVGIDAQELLLHDDRFYVTPYIGKKGWISLDVATRVDWKEIRDLVARSYDRVV
jgi:predicted DNA-binding protein (MmcQ/YjbR family)